VDVSPQPHVVGEIPAEVVRVLIDHDVIPAPVPIAAVANVIGRDAEIEPAEPEARRATAGKMPQVAAAESAGEMAVLPRMIEMVVRVVRTRVVSDPLAIRVDVRSLRMTGRVAERAMFCRRSCRSFMNGRGTMRGWASASDAVLAAMLIGFGLCKSRNGNYLQNRKKADAVFHAHLRAVI
jgi:hypothetical protein